MMSEGWKRVFIVASVVWAVGWLLTLLPIYPEIREFCGEVSRYGFEDYCDELYGNALLAVGVAFGGPLAAWLSWRYISRGFEKDRG